MSQQRNTRELAMQTLYQLEARGEADLEQIEKSVQFSPFSDASKSDSVQLARRAWAMRQQVDAMATELAPDWPTHRQPPVDRAILRLAGYEILSGATPVPVAINEAVELAKAYGSEKSPSFVNGVLDKLAQKAREQGAPEAPPQPEPQARPEDAEKWLSDAIDQSRPTT